VILLVLAVLCALAAVLILWRRRVRGDDGRA
jgi:hypothetical protein